MNIIQVQDRLKGVSDDALKGYVTNPTGDVPTYLALGEIGRREDVRKEYQAAQAEQPQKTVAEEKLAAMPQGIGSLTQGMAAPQPQGISQPPMQSMNPAISETGVANLATPNMPQQNFEAGGIVTSPIVNNSNPYFPFDSEVGGTYGMPQEPMVNDYKDYLQQKKDAFGIGNDYYEDERAAIKEEKELLRDRKKELPYDGMIRAGLNTAAGQSSDFVTNLARGAIPAFDKYGKESESMRKEEKLNRKEDRLVNKQMRAEAMGDMAGFDAYNKEIRATQLKLIEIETDKLSKALKRGVDANSAEYKLRDAAMDKAIKVMGGGYGSTGALVTKFGDDKEGYNKELVKNFRQQYTLLGGADANIAGIMDTVLTPEDEGGLQPRVRGVPNTSAVNSTKVQPKEGEIITAPDGKKYRKLPNGKYTPV